MTNRTLKTLYGVRPDQANVIDHRLVNTLSEVCDIIAENRRFGWGSRIQVIRFGAGWNCLVAERHIPLRTPDFPFDLSQDVGID